MIFKQETQILKCTFEKEHFSKVKAAFKDRWPVVYIIEDDEKGQAYIGESTNICTRICDHCIIRKSKFPQNPKRSVRFSGKRTKRSVQKRKARNTQKAETKVL